MKNATGARVLPTAGLNQDQLFMLYAEIEILAANDTYLKKIAGAAALFISQLEYGVLPKEAIISAATLDSFINEMPDDLMMEALQLVRS